jgi:hypothetical protein
MLNYRRVSHPLVGGFEHKKTLDFHPEMMIPAVTTIHQPYFWYGFQPLTSSCCHFFSEKV